MFRWIGLALLGIVVAAAVSVAASRLASQQIGLASQPVSAGDALVPAAERRAGRVEGARGKHAHAHARAPGTTSPPAAQPPLAPSRPVEPRGDEEAESSGPDD